MNFKTIYTEGEYLRNNPDWSSDDSVWKAGMIIAILKKNEARFTNATEIGCGAGRVLKNIQEAYPEKQFTGYDISPQAIAMAKPLENASLHFFRDDLIAITQYKTDLLLMIDVVEHISDYYGFMAALKNKAEQFVFHIPLDQSCRAILKPHINLQQRTAVGHIHYFTEENVWWMLKDCGYTILDWHYTKPRIDIDKARNFKTLIKKWLRNFSFAISKKMSVKLWGGYSVMVLAK